MSNRVVSTGPYLITTAPSITVCHRCRRPVLSATVEGIDRKIDPATLNDTGELAALLAGRPTFDLTGELLVRRYPERILAGRPRPVLAEHACTSVPDAHLDHAHVEAAVRLVRELLGGQPIDPDTPPPF